MARARRGIGGRSAGDVFFRGVGGGQSSRGRSMGSERVVRVAAGPVMLEGNLTLPERAQGVVLFAHGSGSSRHSPRNRYVAKLLNVAKLATLEVDLLDRKSTRLNSSH